MSVGKSVFHEVDVWRLMSEVEVQEREPIKKARVCEIDRSLAGGISRRKYGILIRAREITTDLSYLDLPGI